MSLLEYTVEFTKLKKLQRPIVEKYNRCSSKSSKRKLYTDIMVYEDLLFTLKERHDKK